jgi:hypothetical protein
VSSGQQNLEVTMEGNKRQVMDMGRSWVDHKAEIWLALDSCCMGRVKALAGQKVRSGSMI